MLTKDAVAYFGSVSRLARVLGCTRVAIYLWPERVPDLRQLQLEQFSKGRLKAESRLKLKPSAEWVDPLVSARAKFTGFGSPSRAKQ